MVQLLLQLSTLYCLCLANGSDNKTFVFVSGWPQSGTSLIQQILTVIPEVSTMVQGCNKKHGNKCLNWNHEGQWILPRNEDVSPYVRPGCMCPVGGKRYGTNSVPERTRSAVQSSWLDYWDLSKPILAEKSPQSLLKTHMLSDIFDRAVERDGSLMNKIPGTKALKFLIVVKHPVTLNVATPEGTEWLTNTLKNALPSEPKAGASAAERKAIAKTAAGKFRGGLSLYTSGVLFRTGY